MKILIILALLSNTFFAQNLDSLYNLLLSSRGAQKDKYPSMQSGNSFEEKCGFGLSATIREYYEDFSPNQQMKISEIMQRPELATSIVSPSGIFRIHFDEDSVNQPGYSISELAIAFDSSYNFEVNILGYPAPPNDNQGGGDDKIDVYLVDLARNYGYTEPEVSLGDGKSTSYIVMDNNFGKDENFNTFGINAAKVTAAHELHHVIQLGNYLYRSADLFYYELTSTAFEEFVFDNVNDYYFYMPSFFRSTTSKLENSTGYNSAIWNIFLQEYFKDEDVILGHQIIKKSWENMIGNRAMVAISNAIESETLSSFAELFNEFGSWLYFTGDNSKEDRFFEEAINYPSIRSTYNLDLNSTRSISFNSEPTSINYLTFLDYDFGFADTIVAVVSNSDVFGSISNTENQFIDFTLSNSFLSDGILINDVYFYKLGSDKIEKINFIQSNYVINNELSDLVIQRNDIDFVYPQPFSYKLANVLNLPTNPDPSGLAQLYIYSSGMDLVYSGKEQIITSGNTVVRWNGFHSNGKKLGSGVYVFVTKANGKIKKGKFVILN